MRTYEFDEAKIRFNELLAAVEAGEEIAITRHGRVIARVVPDTQRIAADLFRPFWGETDINLEAPVDKLPEPVASLD